MSRRAWALALLLALPGLAAAAGITVTPAGATLTANDLASALVGGGMTFSNAVLTGSSLSAGTFTGGAGIVDFNAGVVLSSGLAASLPGPNNTSGSSTEMGMPGDPALSALAGGAATYDASELEFDFVPQSGLMRFNYVFGSDEYPEFVNSAYNDVFAIFVNGVNTALIPGTALPVSIHNVNATTDPSYFVDNSGAAYNVQMDGFTTGLAAWVTVTPGVTNHIKFAIADVADSDLDSWVLIQSGSLVVMTPTNSPTPTATPSPSYSVSPTLSPSCTQSQTYTLTQTFTLTPTYSVTPTLTPTPSVTNTYSATPTPSRTWTCSQTPTFSPSPTYSVTATITLTLTPTPRPLTLSKRSPNPDPATGTAVWLPYTLSVNAKVTMKVYDVAGEAVKHFDPVQRDVGDHEERWDLRNNSGSPVASGVFLVRIQADDDRGETAVVWEKCSVAR